jgi:ActR/RegA family two-component response regulator
MGTERIRLLFVDDDNSIRETLPIILRAHGFDVSAVATVAEAIAEINQRQFDVLLADLNIGEPGDGFTVVSAMRRLQPRVRTLILTGYPDFATALEAIRRQVDDYLIKPTDVPTLLKILTSATRAPAKPRTSGKRASTVIRENSESIIENWFHQTKSDPQFKQLQVPKDEFIDHVPDVLQQLEDRLEKKPEFTQKHKLESALAHGRTRRQQGSSATLIVVETRILYRVIADCIQANLLDMDISAIVPDLILVSDTLNEMLSESLRSFLSVDETIAA